MNNEDVPYQMFMNTRLKPVTAFTGERSESSTRSQLTTEERSRTFPSNAEEHSLTEVLMTSFPNHVKSLVMTPELARV